METVTLGDDVVSWLTINVTLLKADSLFCGDQMISARVFFSISIGFYSLGSCQKIRHVSYKICAKNKNYETSFIQGRA